MLIVICYVIFFFNPLITPLYNIGATKRLYGFGFVFIVTLLVITILNFFKEMESFKETKCLTLLPIIFTLTLFLVGVFIYKDFFQFKERIVSKKRIHERRTTYQYVRQRKH